MTELDNPYWWALQRLITKGAATVDANKVLRPVSGHNIDLNLARTQHSPTISDPDLVEWLAKVSQDRVVEVDAVRGYWAYLLNQFPNKRVRAYDLNPRFPNHYPTEVLDRQRMFLREHSSATMICMTDRYPYNSTVFALSKFPGSRAILSCERNPYDTAALKDLLTREWVEESRMGSGLKRWDEPRIVYEFRRKTFWNQDTKLMPVYSPPEVSSD